MANRSDQTLSRLDAATGKLRDTTGAGVTPLGLAVGGGAVWTTDRDVVIRRSLAYDEPRTIELKGPNFRFGGALGARPGSPMTAGAGAIWVAHSYSLERLDPATGRSRVVRSDLGGSPTALVAAFGSLWVADSASGAVVHIDPRTRQSKAIAPAQTGSDGDFGGVQVGGVAAGAGAIWATATTEDAVVRIDPQTELVTRRIHIGDRPNGIAYGEGAVWSANTDGTVSRIDPGSGRVTRIHVGGTPTAVAVANGRVWVSVQK